VWASRAPVSGRKGAGRLILSRLYPFLFRDGNCRIRSRWWDGGGRLASEEGANHALVGALQEVTQKERPLEQQKLARGSGHVAGRAEVERDSPRVGFR